MTRVFCYTRMLIVLAVFGGFGACDDKDEVPHPESFRVTGEIYGNGSPVSGVAVKFNGTNEKGFGYGSLGTTEEDGSFDITINYEGMIEFSLEMTDNAEEDQGQYEDKEILLLLRDFTVVDRKASKNLGRIELTRRAAN